MGKFSDALRKAASATGKNTDSRGKAQTTAPVQEAPFAGEEAIDSLRLKPPVNAPAVTKRIFQTLPVSELLVTCHQDNGGQASFAGEQFKMLRSQLLFPTGRPVPKTLLVTSAIPGEGKSMVSSNLAVSIALGRQEHVLLIEGDLRRPSLARLFGLRNSRGLSDYLLEEDELSDLFCKTPIDKLTLLPAGQKTNSPYELLSSQRMIDLLKEARNRYQDRYVILDSTPAQVAAETSVLSNFIDGVVLVVRYGYSSRKMIRETVEKIGKEKFLGVVFNAMQGAHPNSYYYKYYGYETKKLFRFFRRKQTRQSPIRS
jgi:protein-tyrosine kinase